MIECFSPKFAIVAQVGMGGNAAFAEGPSRSNPLTDFPGMRHRSLRGDGASGSDRERLEKPRRV